MAAQGHEVLEGNAICCHGLLLGLALEPVQDPRLGCRLSYLAVGSKGTTQAICQASCKAKVLGSQTRCPEGRQGGGLLLLLQLLLLLLLL